MAKPRKPGWYWTRWFEDGKYEPWKPFYLDRENFYPSLEIGPRIPPPKEKEGEET